MSNATNFEEPENAAAAFIVILSSLVSITGNGLVMLSFFICQKLRSQPGSSFVINLALSDFLCGVYIQLPCTINLANPKWYFEGVFCVVHSVITWTIMTASNWTLAAISADRAIAIHKPFQHSNWITTFRVRLMIALIWICSLIFSASVIREKSIAYQKWELMCSPNWTKENCAAGYIGAVLCFWIPTIILLGSNISIIYAVRNLRQIVSHSLPEETGQVNLTFCVKDYTKTLRSFYLLVVVYFLCVCPYFLAKFSFLSRDKGILPPSMVVLTLLLMFIGSAVNPFIYAILRTDHKEAFLKTVKMVINKIRGGISMCLGSTE